MKIRKSKLKSKQDNNIRNVIREEIQKSLIKERQIMSSEAIREHHKYFKTAKQKLMLDLLSPKINFALKQSLARNVASHIVKSIMGKL